jgi:P4 family phage/plasmid primase-like protien
VASKGLTDVDLDCPEALAIAPYLLPNTGSIFGRASNPASHWLYKTTLGETSEKAAIRYQDPAAGEDEKGTLVELRIGGKSGAQTVFPGSTHPSGEAIAWHKDGAPTEIDGAKLRRIVAAIAAASLLARHWPGEGKRHDAALALGRVLARAGFVESEIERFAWAVATTAGDSEVSDRIQAAKDSAAAHAKGERAYGLPKLIDLVGERVAVKAAAWLGEKTVASESAEASEIITQDSVADLFADRHKNDLRFCHSTHAWYRWDGSRWQRDEMHAAFQFARKLGRELTKEAKDRELREVRKVAFAAGVEKFAQSDERLAVTVDYWDQDPFLLGTPGGTVDLRTGKLRPSDPADGITKRTAVTPAETAHCPLWLDFLEQTFGGDAGTIRFVQQFTGYSLTGDVREHALAFGSGSGGNGKSVLVNTASGIMGDYATTASMDAFTASKNDRHPTELASLRGARLVTASETEEGRAWAEAKIKQLTGGDKIAARYMRQDFFEFRPQFKLFIVGNHQPELRAVDDAMKRRVNILPFNRKPANPDRRLEEKLRAEWPAILRWMLLDCLDWQANGLLRPASVMAATSSYFEEQDVLGRWLEEECDRDTEGKHTWFTGSSVLFESWTAYAKAAGEHPGNTKTFASAMRRQGLQSEHKKTGTIWHGVQLKPSYQQARDGTGDR